MGSPKRNRRTYDRPKDIWNLQRIGNDNAVIDEFGLRNMRELWKAQSDIGQIRKNVRMALASSATEVEDFKKKLIGRLSRYGIASQSATLDSLLDLNEKSMLSRRLQSIVFRRGMAKSMAQARQLIVHGFISIGGKRINRPGYLVTTEEEPKIGYFKSIDINAGSAAATKPAAPAQKAEEGAEPAQAE